MLESGVFSVGLECESEDVVLLMESVLSVSLGPGAGQYGGGQEEPEDEVVVFDAELLQAGPHLSSSLCVLQTW